MASGFYGGAEPDGRGGHTRFHKFNRGDYSQAPPVILTNGPIQFDPGYLQARSSYESLQATAAQAVQPVFSYSHSFGPRGQGFAAHLQPHSLVPPGIVPEKVRDIDFVLYQIDRHLHKLSGALQVRPRARSSPPALSPREVSRIIPRVAVTDNSQDTTADDSQPGAVQGSEVQEEPTCRPILHRMGIPTFHQWLRDNQLLYELPLAEIHPADVRGEPVIGIEAKCFLEQFRTREPLVPALNGFPLGLEGLVIKQLKQLESLGTKIWVYFDGLESDFDDVPIQKSVDVAKTVGDGYDIYETGDSSKAIEKFRSADYPDDITMAKFVKYVLHKNGIEYVTAPFRALAQMIRHVEQGVIHFIHASTEGFLYGASNLITKFNVVYETHEFLDDNGEYRRKSNYQPEKSTYTWVDSKAVLERLKCNPDIFHDALLLAGSSYLETFPPLLNKDHFRQPHNFRDIVGLLEHSAGDPRRAIETYQYDERAQVTEYEDKFTKAFIVINNMPVVVNMYTTVPRSTLDPNRLGSVPRNLHEIAGLCFPQELFFYLYIGLIGPRVMNWFVKGEIRLFAPMAGEETPQYRTLVKKTLKPFREQAAALLAYSINRWFLHREITTTCWFDNSKESLKCQQLTSVKDKVPTWRMRSKALFRRAEEMKSTTLSQGPGSLFFAFRSLTKTEFASSTISAKPVPSSKQPTDPLESVKEIVANVIWRFMFIRGYVDDKHQLTAWGKIMLNVIDALGPQGTKEQAEAAFVAVEMLRLGLLNVEEPVTGGGPSRGDDTDKLNCVLVSRVASIGKMRHPAKGYSGPLSRSLLAFHSMVTEVRRALRDLIEINAAVIFMDNQAQRMRKDQKVIADMLPFEEETPSALGILSMTYLDEITMHTDPENKESQALAMQQCEQYLVHTDVEASYREAVKLWSVVAKGVSTSGKLVGEKSKELFARANEWLVARSKPFL